MSRCKAINCESPALNGSAYCGNCLPDPELCLHCGNREHPTGEHIKATLIDAARDRQRIK